MRLLIEFSETKREIDDAFMICGSREDLRHMAHQILNATAEEFCYGWVTVYADGPASKPDNPPQPWDRAHSEKKAKQNAD